MKPLFVNPFTLLKMAEKFLWRNFLNSIIYNMHFMHNVTLSFQSLFCKSCSLSQILCWRIITLVRLKDNHTNPICFIFWNFFAESHCQCRKNLAKTSTRFCMFIFKLYHKTVRQSRNSPHCPCQFVQNQFLRGSFQVNHWVYWQKASFHPA